MPAQPAGIAARAKARDDASVRATRDLASPLITGADGSRTALAAVASLPLF